MSLATSHPNWHPTPPPDLMMGHEKLFTVDPDLEEKQGQHFEINYKVSYYIAKNWTRLSNQYFCGIRGLYRNRWAGKNTR